MQWCLLRSTLVRPNTHPPAAQYVGNWRLPAESLHRRELPSVTESCLTQDHIPPQDSKPLMLFDVQLQRPNLLASIWDNSEGLHVESPEVFVVFASLWNFSPLPILLLLLPHRRWAWEYFPGSISEFVTLDPTYNRGFQENKFCHWRETMRTPERKVRIFRVISSQHAAEVTDYDWKLCGQIGGEPRGKRQRMECRVAWHDMEDLRTKKDPQNHGRNSNRGRERGHSHHHLACPFQCDEMPTNMGYYY